MKLKICIADDHPVVREGIRRVVQEAGIEVTGFVDSSDDIVDSVEKGQPEVLVTEVRLQGHDALKTLERLNIDGHQCSVLVFSSNPNPSNIARASALGCHDFLMKTATTEELIAAIKKAASREPTPDDSLLNRTKVRMSRGIQDKSLSSLTPRETQVLRHVAMGLSNREVGKSLGISVETVKEHVQNILRKLDVNDRTQAAVWALKNEMI